MRVDLPIQMNRESRLTENVNDRLNRGQVVGEVSWRIKKGSQADASNFNGNLCRPFVA